MAERKRYSPGTFCWTDLTTTDQAAAKGFYTTLFGWEPDDRPVTDGVYYSMQSLDGRDVGAISPQPPDQVEAGAPPAWNSYISVASADATAQRARELGATVMGDPFDVMDAGRMAVMQDPQGAFFSAWEPREHPGAGLVNAPGALSWNELSSPDLGASEAFYGGLFGWTFEAMAGSPIPYRAIMNGDRSNGGIAKAHGNTPPGWLTYFGTHDVAESLSTVEERGGETILPADELPMGTIGIARDPEGAVFALYAGRFAP